MKKAEVGGAGAGGMEAGREEEEGGKLSMVQLDDVCSVMALLDWVWTPSMMSISPEEGQLGPRSQLCWGEGVLVVGCWF